MMSLKTVIMVSALGFVSFSASAEILALEGTGTVEMFSSGFNGADLFPFVGLNDGDAISYRYQFDTNTSPASIEGGFANYEFDSSGSYMQLGDSVLNFDSVTLRIGTHINGNGVLSFTGYNSALGVITSMLLLGPDSLSMDLPQSIDFESFTSGREFYANSDANEFLLPIVFGNLNNAQITPAPGVLSVALCSLLYGSRRRTRRVAAGA